MTWGRVNQTVGAASSVTIGTSYTMTFPAATAGNLLVIVLFADGTLSPSPPTNWTNAAASGGVGTVVFYKIATGGETSATSGTFGATRNCYGEVAEYSGVWNPVNITSTTATAPNMSPPGANVLYIAAASAIGSSLSAPSWSGTAGVTAVDSNVQSTFLGSYADKLGVTGSSLTASMSVTGTPTSTNYSGITFASATDGALVKAGAISTAAAASVTPAFGQATTAGNLLVARVQAVGATSPTTTASGWVKVTPNGTGAVLFYKLNCGAGETAPTFTDATATSMSADLTEWSGVATTAALDKSQGATTGGTTPTLAAADTNASDLVICVSNISNSKSGTATISEAWTPSGGTIVAAQGTNATKSLNWMWGSAYLLNGNGGGVADKDALTVTPSTGAVGSSNYCIASFLPATITVTPRPVAMVVKQAINRAANW